MKEDLSARPRVRSRENLARYVGGSQYDPSTEVVNGGAFFRKEKDVDGLSVTRRNIFSAKDSEDEREIRRAVGATLTLGKSGIFAEVNTGGILHALERFNANVFVCVDPKEPEGGNAGNKAHALVVNLPFPNEPVGSLTSELAGDLMREQIIRRFPAWVADER